MLHHRLSIKYTRNRRAKKKRRALKKKVCCCSKVFCGQAYSTHLIRHILSASEPSRKKSRWMDKSTYSRKMNREEKKTNTVSFQSTNKESMITPFVSTKLILVLRTYTQLHRTWRHNTTKTECLKEIMLETTWNHLTHLQILRKLQFSHSNQQV